MDERESIIQIITLAVIAGIAGGVRYIGTYLEKSAQLAPELVGKVKIFQIRHFAAQTIVSSFCGALVGFAVTKSFPDWTYVIAGFSGVFGLEFLRLMLLLAVRVFGNQAGVDVKDIKLKDD